MEIRAPQSAEEWQDYYDLRYRLLRQPWKQPKGSEQNEGDATAQHFALYDHKKLVAVARLDAMGNRVFQVRFFAVEQTEQDKGYGKILMHSIEQVVLQQQGQKIILQARENALPFYSKLGYQTVEKTHLLFGEIQHFLMVKTLKSI